MKKILEDLKAENFSVKEVLTYGVVYPLVLMVILVVTGALE